MISQKTGTVIIVIIVIFLNLWLMAGNHAGRHMDDYYGDPNERYEKYQNDK